MDIKNKVAIITGASSGIGLALAKELSARGAKVVISARSGDKLKQLESEIPNSFALPADMGKPEDIKNLIRQTLEKFGQINILVNNAGQGLRAPLEKIDAQDFRDLMEINVFGPLIAMQEAIPIMKKQGGGLIINISSQVTRGHIPNLSAYSSTKYALNSISLTARQELEKDNIVVSVFYPKTTATNFGQNVRGEKYDSRTVRPGIIADTPEAVAEKIADQIETETAEEFMR